MKKIRERQVEMPVLVFISFNIEDVRLLLTERCDYLG